MRFRNVIPAALLLSGAACGSASAHGAGPAPEDQHPLGIPHHHATKRPNIVFILTDDQDIKLNSLDYVPLIKKHLLDRGTLYKKHFCTTALCCPSRVSLWTGKLAHNTNVTDVNPPHGKSDLSCSVSRFPLLMSFY